MFSLSQGKFLLPLLTLILNRNIRALVMTKDGRLLEAD